MEAITAHRSVVVVDILTAVIDVTIGFLSAFATIHECKPLANVERELFCQMYKAVTGEDLNGKPGTPLSDDKLRN